MLLQDFGTIYTTSLKPHVVMFLPLHWYIICIYIYNIILIEIYLIIFKIEYIGAPQSPVYVASEW